jgi:hypothetical protein
MDDDYIDETEFRHGINAYQQAGFTALGLGTVDVLGINKRFDSKIHFKETVNAIAQQLREERIRITNEDINQLIEMADYINDPQYKNPTAYVLGYIASEGGRNIDKRNINNIFNNVLSEVSDKSVKQEDILRYTRLWYNIFRESKN